MYTSWFMSTWHLLLNDITELYLVHMELKQTVQIKPNYFWYKPNWTKFLVQILKIKWLNKPRYRTVLNWYQTKSTCHIITSLFFVMHMNSKKNLPELNWILISVRNTIWKFWLTKQDRTLVRLIKITIQIELLPRSENNLVRFVQTLIWVLHINSYEMEPLHSLYNLVWLTINFKSKWSINIVS